MTIGDILKNKRKSAGLTQVQLAEASGVSQQAISFIESGRNTPSEGTMRLLAKGLSCSITELMGENHPPDDLSTQEYQLLMIIRELNKDGISKVLEYANDLVDSGNYKKMPAVSAG